MTAHHQDLPKRWVVNLANSWPSMVLLRYLNLGMCSKGEIFKTTKHWFIPAPTEVSGKMSIDFHLNRALLKSRTKCFAGGKPSTSRGSAPFGENITKQCKSVIDSYGKNRGFGGLIQIVLMERTQVPRSQEISQPDTSPEATKPLRHLEQKSATHGLWAGSEPWALWTGPQTWGFGSIQLPQNLAVLGFPCCHREWQWLGFGSHLLAPHSNSVKSWLQTLLQSP